MILSYQERSLVAFFTQEEGVIEMESYLVYRKFFVCGKKAFNSKFFFMN